MFLLAVISFFQLTVIPGFLALKYAGVKLESRIQALLYGFSLSLLINYLIAFFLTAVGLFRPLALYLLLAVEAGLLVYYFRRSGGAVIEFDFRKPFDAFRDIWRTNSLVYNLLLVLSLIILGIFFVIILSRVKAVFYLNDPVLGWNRFALGWFGNHFPVRTAHYPQLIPANWSLAYVLMRTSDMQMVVRNIMPFFSVGILLLFMDLGLRKRRAVYFGASVVYGLMILYLYRPVFITSGYVDIAVSFFSLLAFSVLHGGDDTGFDLNRCFWSVLFACTAAVTKQSGLFILVIVISWNVYLLVADRLKSSGKETGKAVLVMALLVLVIVASWYAYRQVLIHQEAEPSEIAHVTQRVHGGRTYLERFAYGFGKILKIWGRNDVRPRYFVYPFIFFMLLGLFHRKSRYMTLFIVIPFTLLWGFLYSYSYRNLTPAFPFMALAVVCGWSWVMEKLGLARSGESAPAAPAEGEPCPTAKGLRVPVVHASIFILVVLMLLNFTVFSADVLLGNQLTQQRNVGNREFNEKLYGYLGEHGFEGGVYSQYDYFQYLPELRNYWSAEMEGAAYFLCDKEKYKNWWRKLRKKIKENEYTLVLSYRQYRLVRMQ